MLLPELLGGAQFFSEKPGENDFDLFKKIVLPDGSLLRAQLSGRPTKIACLLIQLVMGQTS